MRSKITIIILILLPSLSHAQFGPLLDQFTKISPSECPTYSKSSSENESSEEPEREGYSGHDYSSEPQHYSWDNIYLEPMETEVILNPYKGMSEEEEPEED